MYSILNQIAGEIYNTIQYKTIQYNTIQYITIQYNTLQYNTIQYNKDIIPEDVLYLAQLLVECGGPGLRERVRSNNTGGKYRQFLYRVTS